LGYSDWHVESHGKLNIARHEKKLVFLRTYVRSTFSSKLAPAKPPRVLAGAGLDASVILLIADPICLGSTKQQRHETPIDIEKRTRRTGENKIKKI
jgi:hypothetical protein